ncbi:MAG: nicotinate-nucleotide adenylyltransferase [Alphaproteobacteria bacterium]|nr:nicotinate-nucleotide adenylyltransferase [Alphaproteobacteria bacterium]
MIEPHLHCGAAYSGLTIGLLGGSFNPAHEGHLAMSLYALKHLGLDQIWWLVSPQNPLKTPASMAGLERRRECAARWALHPKLTVTVIENELGTRFTVDTLRELKRRFPRTRFVWLMGADNLRQIPRWKAWRDIFRLVPVAVFRRPAFPAGLGLGQAAIRFARAWHPASQGRKIARLPQKSLPAWIVLDNKLNYTSATRIRKDNSAWQI